jgi:hypothetical protein
MKCSYTQVLLFFSNEVEVRYRSNLGISVLNLTVGVVVVKRSLGRDSGSRSL